jgi:hypothetical protein
MCGVKALLGLVLALAMNSCTRMSFDVGYSQRVEPGQQICIPLPPWLLEKRQYVRASQVIESESRDRLLGMCCKQRRNSW